MRRDMSEKLRVTSNSLKARQKELEDKVQEVKEREAAIS